MGGAQACPGEGRSRACDRGDWPELLFDVTAVLTTSVALSPVAEAFGVHEISRYSVVESRVVSQSPELDLESRVQIQLSAPLSAARLTSADAGAPMTVPVAPPTPFIGPQPDAGSNPEQIVQGTRLLQQLSLLSAATLGDFLEANPVVVESLLAHPPAASDVAMWWSNLDLDRRTALRSASPELVGSLDGVPFPVRDIANRQVLESTMLELEAVIASDAGRTLVENAKTQLRMLTSISDALGSRSAQPARTLLSLDVDGQGRAAIVLGDLRKADYVSYLVPGMFFTIENQMGDWADAAARLYDEQLSWLELFGEPDSTVATVAWIGYDTPNLTNVGSIENAAAGRDTLASAILGLKAIRADDDPYITVIAHSYGSTAALMALQEYDFEIDALAMVGSPGSSASSVADLNVRDGNVFVGEAAWDPIPNSAYFGSDPGSDSYGAKPLGVSGGIDAITREVLLASTGHNEYFSPGTESMRNFALVAIDRGQFVTHGVGSSTTGVLSFGG